MEGPQFTYKILLASSLSEDEFEEIIDSMSNWIKSNQRIRTVMEKSLVAVQVHLRKCQKRRTD